VAEILNTQRITQPDDPNREVGLRYRVKSDDGLRHTVDVEIYGEWLRIAKASSDPNVHALLDDKQRLELVKRISDEASWPSLIRVTVREDGRLGVSRTPTTGFPRFEND
jgi:hypothetical protein